MTEIIADNITAAEFIKKTLLGVDASTISEALSRVKDHAYKTEIIGGEAAFFLSARVLREIENIKKERGDKQEAERKEKLKIQKELQEEFKPPEESPPVIDSSLAEPKRVASREELQNMLMRLDKNYKFIFDQINGFNDALDVMQSDIKMLKDKVQRFEDIINKAEVDK
jgi:hypothetical protein